MHILSLNCQKGYQSNLYDFLNEALKSKKYDFLLLQEVSLEVLEKLFINDDYVLLRTFNKNNNQWSHITIIYLSRIRLIENKFFSFSHLSNNPLLGSESYWLLAGVFEYENKKILIGSLHLHPGIRKSLRRSELLMAKEHILSIPHDISIFWGDCNFGFPFELSRTTKLLNPEFLCMTLDIGPTLCSYFTEDVPYLPNQIAKILRKFGLSVWLKADHIFVDINTAREYIFEKNVLPNRVSDHSPIELILKC